MCRSEFMDKHERKFHPSYEELREESNARHIKNALKGQLFQGEEYIIKNLGRKEK